MSRIITTGTDIKKSFILGKEDTFFLENGKKIFERLFTFLLCVSRVIRKLNCHLDTPLSQILSKQFFKVHEKKIRTRMCYTHIIFQPVFSREDCYINITEYYFQFSENKVFLNRSNGKPAIVWSSPYDKDCIYVQLWMSFGKFFRRNGPTLILKHGMQLDRFGFSRIRDAMTMSEFYHSKCCVKEVTYNDFYLCKIVNYKNGFEHKENGPCILHFRDDFSAYYREWKIGGKYHNFYGYAIHPEKHHYLWGYKIHPLLVPLKNFLFRKREFDECSSILEKEKIGISKLFFEEF